MLRFKQFCMSEGKVAKTAGTAVAGTSATAHVGSTATPRPGGTGSVDKHGEDTKKELTKPIKKQEAFQSGKPKQGRGYFRDEPNITVA